MYAYGCSFQKPKKRFTRLTRKCPLRSSGKNNTSRHQDIWEVSLQDCCLGAEVEQMPTLKSVDGFVRHETYEGGLEVERFGRAPVEPHDGIKRGRDGGRM